MKGFGYNTEKKFQSLTLSDQIFSVGLEARMSTTVGYVLPVNIIFGVYGPLSRRYALDSFVTGLSIQLGGF